MNDMTTSRTGSLNDFDAHENVNQAANESHTELVQMLSKRLRDIVTKKWAIGARGHTT